MATTKAGPVNADRLKSFIERIEKLEEERKAIGGDVKDVYSEAKGVGYDVATMRKIVALRAKDPADRAEAETLLDVYKVALGMAVDTAPREPTEDELAEMAGRIAGEVDRCMALVRDGCVPKIEDIKRLIGCSNGKAQKLRGMIATRLEQFSRLLPQTRENENSPTHPGISQDGGERGDEHEQDDGDFGRAPAVGVGDPPQPGRILLGGTGVRAGGCAANSEVDAVADTGARQAPSQPEGTPRAPVSVGAVGPSSARVAHPTEDEGLAAMDAARESYQAALLLRRAQVA